MLYSINTEICTFCGLCAEECPPEIISLDRNKKSAVIDHGRCLQCSHCAAVCPVGAVTADGETPEEYPEWVTNGRGSNKEFIKNVEHLIISKRSVRHYRDKPLSTEDIDAIMLAGGGGGGGGRMTATATNSMQVKPLFLQGEAVGSVSKLAAGILLKTVNFGITPPGRLILSIAGLKRYTDRDQLLRFRKLLQDTIGGKKDALFFNAPAAVILTYKSKGKRFGRTDCALAGQNMMLAAQTRGIGSCMIGFVEAALLTEGLRRKAGVPKGRKIGLVFTLGYTDRMYMRYPLRESWQQLQ